MTESKDAVVDALNELKLATILAGEDVAWVDPREDHATFFDPFGKPLPGDVVEQARAFEELRLSGENHLRTSLWWNDRPVEVSTVYLGVNMNWWGGPPIVWETMIFTDLDRDGLWQNRYCTRVAAFRAHPLIIECLLAHGFVYAEPELEHAHDEV